MEEGKETQTPQFINHPLTQQDAEGTQPRAVKGNDFHSQPWELCGAIEQKLHSPETFWRQNGGKM